MLWAVAAITYDCKGFGLHDMALLNKKHDPQGGAAYAKYRYYGDVQIISTERLFKLMEIPRDESFSINAPNVDEVKDVFRILFVKDFDDPFYLRLLESMMPLDEMDSPANTQGGSNERTQLIDPLKSSKKGSMSEKKSSIKNVTPVEVPVPMANKLKEKLQNGKKKEVEKNKEEKAVKPKKVDRTQKSDFLRTRPTQSSEMNGYGRSSTKRRRDRSLEEEEVKTEPTMPDDYG
ncbi:hypothetical protein Aduo_009784 [Ancylostoma duodenale]